MPRKKITTPEELIAWRDKWLLSQAEAAGVFRRCRRSYQSLEAGELKEFPAEIDDLAQLYEIKNRKRKKRVAATA